MIAHVRGRIERARASYRTGVMDLRSSLFWRILRKQKPWLKAMIALQVLGAAANSQVAGMTASLVDRAIVAQVLPPNRFLWPIVEVLLLNLCIGFTSRLIMERIAYWAEFDIRTALYVAVETADPRELDSVEGGQLITRALTDLRTLEQALRILPNILALGPVIVGFLAYLLVVSPPIALIAAAGLPVNIWLVRRFNARLRSLTFAELNERAEVTAAIDEPVRGIRVVHAFGRDEHEQERVRERAMAVFRYSMSRVRLLARYDILMKLAPVLIQGGFVYLGAHLVADRDITLGIYTIAYSFIVAIAAVSQNFDELASNWQYLQNGQKRLAAVLALGSRRRTFGQPLPPATSGVQLDAVDLGRDGHPVLAGFDLAVGPGELVVLTGAPGSGKSTVALAAAGIVTPDAGVALLDGVDLAELDGDAVRRTVRLVREDPYLFATTIRENLGLASPGATDEALDAALWASAAREVVDELPLGLDGEVGDRGLTLSGGQRQRIALARALVDLPRVLVLDDALSAVSPSQEVEILRRIRAHAPDAAILCVSRREGPVAIADRVVRLPDPVGEPHADGEAASTRTRAMAADLGRLARARAGVRDADALQGVAGLRLSDDEPGVDEAEVGHDHLRFWRAVRPFLPLAGLAFFGVVLSTLARLLPGFLFGSAGDYAKQGNTSMSDLLALGIVGFGLAFALSHYLAVVSANRFSQGFLYLVRRRLFRRLSRLGIDYYDRESPGQVAARVVYDVDRLLDFLQQPAFIFLVGLLQFAIGMAIIGAVGGMHVLSVVAVFSLLLLAVTAIQVPVNNHFLGQARDHVGVVTHKFEEDFAARHEIRAYGAQSFQLDKFLVASRALRRIRRHVAIATVGFAETLSICSNVLLVMVLVRSGDLVLAGGFTVGTALALRTITQQASQPLGQVGAMCTQLLEVRVSWQRLKQPFAEPILPAEDPAAVECPPLQGRVAFDGVAFSYPHIRRRVLHDISFSLDPGETVALVGYTGAGKSSIAKLLLRMYDPEEGSVTVDGHDLRGIDLRSYRRRVAVVPQDAFVFKGTVATNIAYGRPEADRATVVRAARAAGAHDVLANLAGGLDHPVEDEGHNLTAAQRQLIAIARALLVEPPLLVLDEATSALDAGLEATVLDAVRSVDCTKLMVTHRENVVRRADRVIVLAEGRVVEVGTPAELFGKGSAFDRLWVAVDDAGDAGAPEPVGAER